MRANPTASISGGDFSIFKTNSGALGSGTVTGSEIRVLSTQNYLKIAKGTDFDPTTPSAIRAVPSMIFEFDAEL